MLASARGALPHKIEANIRAAMILLVIPCLPDDLSLTARRGTFCDFDHTE